jgi:tetratricopeptide (TPR) repeat protein
VGRYRLLETVRQYAREKLTGSGEEANLQQRHGEWSLSLAEAAEPKLMGPEQREWLERLEREHDNFRKSLSSSLDAGSGVSSPMTLRLCGALLCFWWTRGYLTEGLSWCRLGLAAAGAQERDRARTKVLNGSGALSSMQGDYPSARACFEQSLEIDRELGNLKGIASSLNGLGNVAQSQGDYAAARTYHEQSLEIAQEIGDRQGIANSLGNLGNVAVDQGDYTAARTYHEQSLEILREIGDRGGIANALHGLGNAAISQGDYTAARTYHEQGLEIAQEIGDRQGIANSLGNLGLVAAEQSDYAAARTYHEQSLEIAQEIGDRQGIAYSLEGVAELAGKLALEALTTEDTAISQERMRTDLWRAARLWGAAKALREQIGAPLSPQDQERQDQVVAEARERLGGAEWEAAWNAGSKMTIEEAVTLALQRDGAHA